jgi:hypothetical protein
MSLTNLHHFSNYVPSFLVSRPLVGCILFLVEIPFLICTFLIYVQYSGTHLGCKTRPWSTHFHANQSYEIQVTSCGLPEITKPLVTCHNFDKVTTMEPETVVTHRWRRGLQLISTRMVKCDHQSLLTTLNRIPKKKNYRSGKMFYIKTLHVGKFNPLPVLFNSLLHGQKDCFFSVGI